MTTTIIGIDADITQTPQQQQ